MTVLLEQVQAAAAMAVRYSEDGPQGVLDYSLASFPIVEEMLAASVPWMSSLSAGQRDGLVTSFGCYLLESCRRAFGGEYQWMPSEQPVLVVGEPTFHLALTTWDKVRGRLNGDPANDIPFHMEGFIARVRDARPGDRVLFA